VSDRFLQSIAPLLPTIPVIAIYFIGLGYALIVRRRYPNAAWLAIAGLGALTLQQLIALWVQFFAKLEPLAGQDVHAIASMLSVLVWGGYILSLLGSGLLIAAVFVGRSTKSGGGDA
jgi:hydrogenase/urease accessory protein HupE